MKNESSPVNFIHSITLPSVDSIRKIAYNTGFHVYQYLSPFNFCSVVQLLFIMINKCYSRNTVNLERRARGNGTATSIIFQCVLDECLVDSSSGFFSLEFSTTAVIHIVFWRLQAVYRAFYYVKPLLLVNAGPSVGRSNTLVISIVSSSSRTGICPYSCASRKFTRRIATPRDKFACCRDSRII